jgi:hypothetical protein
VGAPALAPESILVRSTAAPTAKVNVPAAHAWSVAAWVGFGLALIGWSDVFIGMYPFRPGNPDWEFGAVSAALDSMPLGAIGLAAATVGMLLSGRRRTLRVMSVFQALVVVFLLGAIALYSLSIPLVIKAVPAAMQGQLKLSIAKAFLLAVTYIGLYVVMARASWRGASALNKHAK